MLMPTKTIKELTILASEASMSMIYKDGRMRVSIQQSLVTLLDQEEDSDE